MTSNDYRSGYGQARADAVHHIEEAMFCVLDAIRRGVSEGITPEQMKSLRLKHEALQWTRAIVKTVRPRQGIDGGTPGSD